MTNKEKYRQFCKANSVALYQNDWWLDAVCGEKNWDAVICEKNENMIGAFAYPFKKKYGLKLISMPLLTHGLGPVAERGKKQEVIQWLSNNIPDFDLFDLYFLQDTNPEDFQWKEFKQNKRYSYRIQDLNNVEKIFSAFNSSTRQQIRKAEKIITVSESSSTETLYKMVSLTFKRQDKKIPYSLSYLKNITEACKKNNCGKILVAKDTDGNIHGACLLAWDKQTAYYVTGGSDPKHKSSAAYSLLMWKMINEAVKNSRDSSTGLTTGFDFCGSMIPSIERFFKGFGAEQKPYFHLKKVNSKALQLLLKIKGS